MKKIEKITPIINRFPKKYKPNPEGKPFVEVEEWEEFQNGWNYGENGLIGKINEIIEALNELTTHDTNK